MANTVKEEPGIEYKNINVKVTKDMWLFLKKISIDKSLSMTDIANSLLDKYRKREESKLLQ